jgi:hypothetical protein
MSEDISSYGAHKIKKPATKQTGPDDLDALPDEVVAQLSREVLGPYVVELRRRTIQLQQQNAALRGAIKIVSDAATHHVVSASLGSRISLLQKIQNMAALLQESEG